MSGAISVSKNFLNIKEIASYQGISVPWEVSSFQADYAEGESSGGFFDLSHWSIIELQGVDSADFLQRLSTINIAKLSVGQVNVGAFLTGRGTIISMGLLYRLSPELFWFLVPPPSGPRTKEHLEQFHFGEKLEISERQNEWALFGLWNRKESAGPFPGEGKVSSPLFGDLPTQLWRFEQMRPMTWLLCERSRAVKGTEFPEEWGPLLGQRLFEFYRRREGWAQVGIELLEKDLILEGNMDWTVAPSKGCYPGQEVVERIFTYGSVNRKLKAVEFEWMEPSESLPKTPFAIMDAGGSEVGEMRSLDWYPDRPQVGFGLAMIRKAQWAESHDWCYRLPGSGQSVNVRLVSEK